MERAKRLELLRSFLQSCVGEDIYKSLVNAGAQVGSHAEKWPEMDLKLQAWMAEMEEVIEAWPKIDPTVRTGLMAIVRSQKSLHIAFD